MELRIRSCVLLGLLEMGVPLVGGCRDNNTDTCPSPTAIQNGAECTSTDLECPYDVPVTDCDGTVSTVASSCTCTQNQWVCTDPTSQCPGAGGSGGAGGAAAGGSGHGGSGIGGSGHGGSGIGGGGSAPDAGPDAKDVKDAAKD